GHHIVYWVHGGGDELENLVLLCARHHRMVHEGGWRLFRSKAGEIVTVAPTLTFGGPRGPD
ncbi:MAG: HNH endonuclease, partial [Chloroflexi bacterium]